jgi:galactonate dehydratase
LKITKIVPWLITVDTTNWGEYLFVEVRTDEGITGWGEVTTTTKVANRAVAGTIRELNALLVGVDPGRIDYIWHTVFRSFTYMGSRGASSHAVSAIDIALWDIRGKKLGLPIYELLGGKLRDEILLYTHPDQSNFTFPDGEVNKDGVIKEIREICDSGHTGIKFDPFPHYELVAGGFRHGYLDGELSKKGERQAAELTALIRETAGSEVDILIDAHGRFDVPTAIRLCRSLEEAGNIDWFEEPVPVESYNALAQVREKVNAAISVGERLHTRWEVVNILENKLADYIMPDVTWTGGISELKKISLMAEAYYVPMSPHDAAGPINVVAGSHVMATTPNFYRVETHRWDLSKYNKLIDAPLDNSGGTYKFTGKPGLGIEMNKETLKAQVVEGYGD